MAANNPPRPVYRNIHITQLAGYSLPVAGVVSILHRISGALLFLMLPFLIWLFDVSLGSEISYERFSNAFVAGIGFVPAWLLKLVVFALIWAYLHHLIAGLRHLWMDVSHNVGKRAGRLSALATLAASGVLTLALGAKLFGLF
jgi:succinate dehydrogenase / fumarate reductase, cytochrome b subunit